MNNNKSRVVLITGACGGIGKALVNKFSSKGHTIAIADISHDLANFIAYEINPDYVKLCNDRLL
jgi:NAD(P)-dependent dehydrogenase (short-subunit alcohol dehydrogenase family)